MGTSHDDVDPTNSVAHVDGHDTPARASASGLPPPATSYSTTGLGSGHRAPVSSSLKRFSDARAV